MKPFTLGYVGVGLMGGPMVKRLSSLGWSVKGDDEADAIGQLHYLLGRLSIRPQWQQEIDRVDVRFAL